MKSSKALALSTTLVLVAGLLLVNASPASAAPNSAVTTNTGWFDSDGHHLQGHANYCTGIFCGVGTLDYNNFFVFDLSAFAGDASNYGVAKAWVTLVNPGGNGAVLPYQLRSVTTSPSALNTTYPSGSTRGKKIFDDLADGTLLGTMTPVTVNDNPITVDLGAEGKLALTKRLGATIAMGGHIKGGDATSRLFAGSGASFNDVILNFYYGPKTSLTLGGKHKVRPGTRVRFHGALSSPNPACEDSMLLDITIGSQNRSVTTHADGTYAFRQRINKRTKVRVFNPGSELAPACGGSDKSMTVRLG